MKTQAQGKDHRFQRALMRRYACVCLAAAALSNSAWTASASAKECKPVVLHGEVSHGQAFTRPMTPALDFKVEAVPAGWMIRVLPHGVARPPHDYAELANPPYRSPTPLLISTDFAFRAQDAVAWNPRRFRYFTSARQAGVAEAAYQALQQNAGGNAATAQLLSLVPQAGQATFTITDAELAGGTADQTAAAATVATHFAETAHRIRVNEPPSPLGKLLRLTFQVVFPSAGCNAPSLMP